MGFFKTGLILYGAHTAASRGYTEVQKHRSNSNQSTQAPLPQIQSGHQSQQSPPVLPPRQAPQSQSQGEWQAYQPQQWQASRPCTCGAGSRQGMGGNGSC